MAGDNLAPVLPMTEPTRPSIDRESLRKDEKSMPAYIHDQPSDDGSAQGRIESNKWLLRETGDDWVERPVSPAHERFRAFFHSKTFRVMIDFGLILLILGWWIPAIINDRPRVRHRWIPSTVFSWFFILLILFHKSKYIPQRPFKRGISTVWNMILGKPWSKIPYKGKLAIGWVALFALVFGTTYGLPVTPKSTYRDRTVSLFGLVLIYGFMFLFSSNHKAVSARTTILGIGFQFIVALFVFRSGAGFSIFTWLATAAGDLLNQGVIGGAAFFWQDLITKNYFFINVLSSIIFFVALCIALFYLGVLTWIIRKCAWFFFKTFGISGAEAVVAVASPFIGQGENVVLVRPYAKLFTRSEFHQVLVSGFATIAGSVLGAYINIFGINGKDLITASVMSIPASIAASKLVYPETQEAETAGRLVVERQEDEDDKSNDVLHALSNGAWFGLRVAGLIFCNVLVIVSTVFAINGILTYIGNAWYITDSNGPLTLELIFGYLLWPVAYMLGVPRPDVLAVSKLIAIKVIQNEFVAYNAFKTTVRAQISPRAQTIVTYALCGFGNLGSLGINIGVMSAIAPKRKADIVKLAPSALITGVFVTLSSAAVAGIVSNE